MFGKKIDTEKLDRCINTPVWELNPNKKYIIISDIHLGDGGDKDNFKRNIEALIYALIHYNYHNYNLILLGDIEELWKFNFGSILDYYDQNIYYLMRKFNVYRVVGNHDLDWLSGIYSDPACSIYIKDKFLLGDYLLIHGHQGTQDSDKWIWLSRILVRTLFKPFESLIQEIGYYKHNSSTISRIPDDLEKVYYEWARKNYKIICGHTHRAIFSSQSYTIKLEEEIENALNYYNACIDCYGPIAQYYFERMLDLKDEIDLEIEKRPIKKIGPEPCYFNTGCCLYTDGITLIEWNIDNLKLVKWDNCGKKYIYSEEKI